MSEKQNDGGEAFPLVVHGSVSECQVVNPGMSLRDWFAGQALIGLVMKFGDDITLSDMRLPYEYADAMLAAREGKEEK